MPHEAEIRTARGKQPVASPESMIVNHHRAGTAEMKVDRLSGGALLHLALAGCVFNNVLRLASEEDIEVDDATVRVSGDFTPEGASTGIKCEIDVRGTAAPEKLREIARLAFDDSAVAAALRSGARVELTAQAAGPEGQENA